ncbi:MAG: GNAT family N-acetyltransferase [Elusimicrobiota bacterium]|jgi:ribosomal protein S18 acetylase RimI-like enzyme|nr:GNAT family N-acetyltransferase [Elusimicrobiota bacterium]
MLEILPNADINEFTGLPSELYKGNPFYIPELRADAKKLLTEDPFWLNAERVLFIARREGRPAGRIAAVINRNHNEYWRDKTGFFGFFECEDNAQTAAALTAAAEAWLKQKGCAQMRGPLNPSSNHVCGVLLDNFDKEPCVMMPYNPPYYDGLLQNAGLRKAKDLLAFERTDKDEFSPRMEKIMQRILKNPAVKIRAINLKNFDEEVETVRNIYNASWARNWGFVPITREEMLHTAKQLKLIVRPELTCVIEYSGAPAGFAVSVPNMNRVLKILGGGIGSPLRLLRALFAWRKIKDCRMIMLGVHPDCRGKGLELLLVRNIVVEGMAKGWNKAELSWILEDNEAIIQTMLEAGCRRTKTYRIYQKDL